MSGYPRRREISLADNGRRSRSKKLQHFKDPPNGLDWYITHRSCPNFLGATASRLTTHQPHPSIHIPMFLIYVRLLDVRHALSEDP